MVVRVLPFLACFATGFSTPVSAQSPGTPKWEIEIHGGGIRFGTPADGLVSLPGPGQTFTTTIGSPTRAVSSWYFGDGTTLFNVVVSSLGRTQLTPLDPVLSRALTKPGRQGASVGARVGRVLTPRLTVEFSVDYTSVPSNLTAENVAGIEASRTSFQVAWTTFLSLPFYVQPRVASTADVRGGSSRHIVSTGVFTTNLMALGNVVPYVTAGGGVISHVGTPPMATLSGSYQFLSGTTFPFTFSESDTVSISAAPPDHAFVGVFGGGVRWHASSRWGLRFEVRGHVNRNTARTLVDANPTRTGAPSGGVSTIAVTTAALQFSTVSAIRSSLSGPRLDGYETYQGRGTEGHVSYSAGMFWRF